MSDPINTVGFGELQYIDAGRQYQNHPLMTNPSDGNPTGIGLGQPPPPEIYIDAGLSYHDPLASHDVRHGVSHDFVRYAEPAHYPHPLGDGSFGGMLPTDGGLHDFSSLF